jgi:hypothetical protein
MLRADRSSLSIGTKQKKRGEIKGHSEEKDIEKEYQCPFLGQEK